MVFFLEKFISWRELRAILKNQEKEVEPMAYLDNELSALLKKLEQYTRLGIEVKKFSFPVRSDLRHIVGELETRALKVSNDYHNLLILKRNPSTKIAFEIKYKTTGKDYSIDEITANLAKAKQCYENLSRMYCHLK
jgi:hypothetical protein